MKNQTKNALRETYASRKVIAEGEEILVTVIGVNFTNDSILQLLTKHADEYLILEYKFRERNVNWGAEFNLLKELFLYDDTVTTQQKEIEIHPGRAGNSCIHTQTEITFSVNHHTSGDISHFTETSEQTDLDKELQKNNTKENKADQDRKEVRYNDVTESGEQTNNNNDDDSDDEIDASEIGYIVGDEADEVNEVINDILQHHPNETNTEIEQPSSEDGRSDTEDQANSDTNKSTQPTADIDDLQIETILTQRLLEAEYHTSPTPGNLSHGMMHKIHAVEPLSDQKFKLIAKTDIGEKIIWNIEIPPADEFTDSPIVSLIENQGSGDPLTMDDGGRIAIVMLSSYKPEPTVNIVSLDETKQWGLVAPSTIETVQDPEPKEESFLDKLKNIRLI
jgi:hypothetical protein